MKILCRGRGPSPVIPLLLFSSFLGVWRAPAETFPREVLVDDGWHPWYEIKQDPESPEKLIICGTKWDALHNAPFGFVAASSDGGGSWRVVLEDRSSAWVTEQSCAFGRNHQAYFLSAASHVVDGKPRHDEGTTRLYVSHDSGEQWTETAKVGWTDYSASAVNSTTGLLYTFFNAAGSGEAPGGSGRIGLRIFSSDGGNAAGPFFDSAAGGGGFGSLYPSDAVALKDGTVAALYYAARATENGLLVELGIVRADGAAEPSVERSAIVHEIVPSTCANFEQGALAYDAGRDLLFVVYLSGCTRTRLMLATSRDRGRTWTKSVAAGNSGVPDRDMACPSLAVGLDGTLAVLWEEGRSGRWRLAYIKDGSLMEPVTELPTGANPERVGNDGLRFWTSREDHGKEIGGETPATSSIALHVEDDSKSVWRGRGLVAMPKGILALWPCQGPSGTYLCSAMVEAADSSSSNLVPAISKESPAADVTDRTVILYGGEEHYDGKTGDFRVCMILGNRGSKPIKVPIELRALEVGSPTGNVSILDEGKQVKDARAAWDISGSIRGGQIAPGGNSTPFCLSFQLHEQTQEKSTRKDLDLLTLRLKVYAAGEPGSP